MRKLITCLAICLLVGTTAFAEISTGNQRLDHVLYVKHPPKLVIAGEIKEIKGRMHSDRELSFDIEEVILGAPALARTTINVSTAAFNWPEDLVRHAVGSFCILIIDGKRLAAIAPAAKGNLRVATNQLEAIQIVEEGIINVLQSETSVNRQKAILLQLAPILRQENSSSVAPLLKSDDQWVKRAALAALIYATEDYEYIRLAAEDIKELFTDESVARCLKLKQSAIECEPAGKFMKNYFFLNPGSWKWGSQWNEEEAAKHIKIWKAILSTGDIPSDLSRFIEGPK